MAIENLKKHLIIELFSFRYSFLAIWPAKEKAAQSRPLTNLGFGGGGGAPSSTFIFLSDASY
jgi:hypothetical protein